MPLTLLPMVVSVVVSSCPRLPSFSPSSWVVLGLRVSSVDSRNSSDPIPERKHNDEMQPLI